MMMQAAHQLGWMVNQVTTALEEWGRNNPEVVRNLVAIGEILTADGQAAWWRDRYDKDGVAIPFEQSVRLAFCLMALRIPGDLTQVYDFEMRGIYALQEGRIGKLIEGAQSSPLDFRALQAALSFLRETNEPIPSELNEWALLAARLRKNVLNDNRLQQSLLFRFWPHWSLSIEKEISK